MSDENKWKTEWVYCPECGSSEFRKHMLGDEEERICFACGQIWFTDIDYTDTIIKVVTALRTRLAKMEEQGVGHELMFKSVCKKRDEALAKLAAMEKNRDALGKTVWEEQALTKTWVLKCDKARQELAKAKKDISQRQERDRENGYHQLIHSERLVQFQLAEAREELGKYKEAKKRYQLLAGENQDKLWKAEKELSKVREELGKEKKAREDEWDKMASDYESVGVKYVNERTAKEEVGKALEEERKKLVWLETQRKRQVNHERTAKEKAQQQVKELSAWGREKHDALERATWCGRSVEGDQGGCVSCTADTGSVHDADCRHAKALALPPPQAYKDWASSMGRLRELGKAILKSLSIHPEKCRGFEDPEDNYEKRTPEMEEWNAKVFAFGEAISDQEIKR